MIEPNQIVGQFSPKEGPKICAMRDIAGRTVKLLALLIHWRHGNDASVLPTPKLPGEVQSNREVREALSQP